MDRDGLRAADHHWQQAVVRALCDSPVLGDRNARAMLAELIGDELGRLVVLREQATMQLQLLELVRFCVREENAANHGLAALAGAVSLLEGPSRTAEAVSELVREHEVQLVREHGAELLREHGAELVREHGVRAAPSPVSSRAQDAPPQAPSRTDRPVHLFVSCAAADLAWTAWITWHLEEAGVGVLLDESDLAPGSRAPTGLLSRLEHGERALAVLSPAYVGSAHVHQAWQAVHRRSPEAVAGMLVPVMVEPCLPRWPLSTIAYTDLTGLGEDEARGRLLDAVGVTHTAPTAPTRHAAPPRFPGPAGRR